VAHKGTFHTGKIASQNYARSQSQEYTIMRTKPVATLDKAGRNTKMKWKENKLAGGQA